MKTQFIIFIALLLLLFSTDSLFAQNETRYWYTGYNAGLDFSTSPPTPIYDGLTESLESTSVMTDPCGDLLFYTDGFYVWTKDHLVMDNGVEIGGGCDLGGNNPIASASQGTLIIPIPFDCQRYYVFTTGCADTDLEDGLRYSIVDMSENGGLGKVVTKNNLLYTPAIEKLNAVFHANRTDLWLITRKYQTNEFYTYRIDSTGLQEEPIISAVGQPSDGSGQGYMQITPNGDRIALVTKDRNPEFFFFDNTNGQITADFILPDSLNIGYYSVAFSPSGQKVYFSSANWFNSIWNVDQFDLTLSSPEAIYASKTTLITYEPDLYKAFGGLQLGRDGVIYTPARAFVENDDYVKTLDAIVNPEGDGMDCAYTENYVQIISDIDTGIPGFTWAFPNSIASYFTPGYQSLENQIIPQFDYVLSDSCGVEPVHFFDESQSYCPIIDWEWNFDDPNSGSDNFSNVPNPSHRFSLPGTYNVRLQIEASCKTAVYFKEIVIGPDVVLGDIDIQDQIFCEGDTISVMWPDETSVSWSTGVVGNQIELSNPGVYWAEIDLGECQWRDSFELFVTATPDFPLEESYQWCEDSFLEISLPNDGNNYFINNELQEGIIVIEEDGLYLLQVENDACTTEGQFSVSGEECPECKLYIPNAFSPNDDGFNDGFQSYSSCLPEDFEMQVFDRWGGKVFETNNIDDFWNGKKNGTSLDSGIYVYWIRATFYEDRVAVSRIYKGDIALIR